MQIKCVWIAPHGRFQAMLTRHPCLPQIEAFEARPWNSLWKEASSQRKAQKPLRGGGSGQ